MQGIILNEGGCVTYPYEIFKHIEEYIKSLNWRITNVECFCRTTTYVFPFEECNDYFVDGETLYNMLKEHPEIQWVWGALSGFTKDITWDEIKQNPVIEDISEIPYLKGRLHHIEPKAVFEMIAFDSAETYIMADNPEIVKRLYKLFPDAENLEKYVEEDE